MPYSKEHVQVLLVMLQVQALLPLGFLSYGWSHL